MTAKRIFMGMWVMLIFGMAATSLSLRLIHAQESTEATEVGPFEQVFAGLVEDGILTQKQAETVMERLGPVIREVVEDQVHRAVAEDEQRERIEQGQLNNLFELLGLEKDEFFGLLKDGETIASLGEDRGVTVEQIVEVMVPPIQRMLTVAVNEGDLEPEVARARLQEAKAYIEEKVRGEE